MASVDKIIEDLIKGASRAGAKVEIHDGKGREVKLASANTPLTNAYLRGMEAAAHQYKIAIWGALAGQIAGPAAASRLAAKIGPRAANFMKGPIGSTAASFAGSELGDRLMPGNG